MAYDFKQTSLTLLARIAQARTGEDEASWVRFFELYQPAMLVFARSIGGEENAEDIVQSVLVKLVDVLRNGQYERREGKSFRAYVKTLIRNQLSDLYRRECVRGYGRKVALTPDIAAQTPAPQDDFTLTLDNEWAMACRKAALDHVLTRMALSPRTRVIYTQHVLKNRSASEVAREFGIEPNSVIQVKSRVERMITAVVAEFGD